MAFSSKSFAPSSPQWNFTPLCLDEGHRRVESIIGDGTAPVDDPGLVNFVFRESDGSQPPRAKVPVDHPHGRIPEHQGQNPSFPDLLGDAP